MRLLWDIGLEIGHSVRTIANVHGRGAKDITVQTSLLEARQLAGHRQLFENFQQRCRPRSSRDFFSSQAA